MGIIQKLAAAGAAGLLTAAISGAAAAADMAAKPYVKAPVPPAPVYNWTGFYIGGNVGAGWGSTASSLDVGNTFIGSPVNQSVNQLLAGTLNLSVPLPQTQMNGFLGGLQTGYNWQSGVAVFGLEGDWTWTGLKGTTSCVLVLNCTAKASWIADITGRMGVTVGDRGLVYLKGGAAWVDTTVGINQSASVSSTLGGGFTASGSINGSAGTDRLGATLGAGIEYGFMPGWSIKVEYDYFDFGKGTINVPITASGGITAGGTTTTGSIALRAPVSVSEQIHMVRAGINYHFNEPVVAKY